MKNALFSHKKNNRRGISLILTVSMMLVLSVMGVSFVQMSTYERVAADNFVAQVDAQLTAFAGLDRATALMFDQLRKERFIVGASPNSDKDKDPLCNGRIIWTSKLNDEDEDEKCQLLYPPVAPVDLGNLGLDNDAFALKDENGDEHTGTEDDLITATREGQIISLYEGKVHNDLFSHSGVVGRVSNGQTIGRYEANGNFYSLKIVDLSGRFNINSHVSLQQAESNLIVRNILTVLGQECKDSSRNQVLQNSEITQIIDTIRPAGGLIPFSSTEVLRNTVLDIFRNNPENELFQGDSKQEEKTKALNQFLDNLTANSFIDTTTAGVNNSARKIAEPAKYYSEDRAPVNINTASLELLTALIKNIKATTIFYINIATTAADTTFGSGSSSFQTETSLVNEPVRITIDFSQGAVAQNVAEKIFTEVNSDNGGNFDDQGDLERFFTDLIGDATAFPAKADARLSDQVWQEACADALKSNFNPNAMENFWNPNLPAFRRTSKGDLFESGLPTHTTELTFYNLSNIEVTSVGFVTADEGRNVISISGVKTELSFGTVLTHTTQQDFQNGGSLVNSLTTPANIELATLKNLSDPSDEFAGAVEPQPRKMTGNDDGRTLFERPSGFGEDFEGDSKIFTLALPETHVELSEVNPMQTFANLRNENNNLSYDGLVSRRFYYRRESGGDVIESPRYFLKRAFEESFLPSKREENEQQVVLPNNSNLRSGETATDSNGNVVTNLANKRGTLEFWLKFDSDSKDFTGGFGVSSGLIGMTTASEFLQGKEDLPPIVLDALRGKTKFQEGVQMYMYRNTLGEMRLSRLYYAFCFEQDGTPYGAVVEENVDGARKLARRDITFNTSNWQAHDWHHIRIIWDDNQSGENSLQLFVDDNQVNGTFEKVDDGRDRQWCVLNEREPYDSFFINGFEREQLKPGGFFLFDTDVKYYGNATIDGMISYTGTTANTSTTLRQQRFHNDARYTNEFEIPHKGLIGAVRWVSYPSLRNRSSHNASGVANVNLNPNVTLEGNFSILEGDDGELREVALPTTEVSNGQAVKVASGNSLSYTFAFNNVEESDASDGRHVCATLDSVTVTILHNVAQSSSIELF